MAKEIDNKVDLKKIAEGVRLADNALRPAKVAASMCPLTVPGVVCAGVVTATSVGKVASATRFEQLRSVRISDHPQSSVVTAPSPLRSGRQMRTMRRPVAASARERSAKV